MSFGLVTVPVKLYSAVERKTVRFHQLSRKTQNRVAQKRVDSQTDEEVPYEDIVKGYEVSTDQYVLIDPGELDALAPQKTKSIEIEDFVELSEIDPVLYDNTYYLAPSAGGAKPYRLLLEAMRDTGKVAIARVVIRSKEHLVAVRPVGEVLVMETMLFSDEVRLPEQLEEMPDSAEVKTTKRELDIAKQLVESLSGEFEPEKYKDTYRQQVLELIERKAEGKEVIVEAAPVKRSAVPDLMSALTASLQDAQKRTGSKSKAKQKKTPVTPSANGTARRRKASAPTSKKVPAS
jgi:DNA end-binding protein Ku